MNNLSGTQREHRTQRHALLAIWAFIAFVGLLLIGYGQLKLQQSRASVDWPTTTGRIVRSRVESSTSDDGTTYSADIKYVYTVDGTEHSSDVVIIGGHEYDAHDVVRRYPVGNSVSVSYSPDDVTDAVLKPGVESYLFQTWGISAFAGSLFMALIFNTILRVAAKEERSLLDKLVIIPCKGLWWSLVFGTRHPFILAALVAAAVYLSTLDLGGVEYVFATVAAVYLLVLAFAIYFKFLGWISSLSGNS